MPKKIDDWLTEELQDRDWHDTRLISEKAKRMGFTALHLKEARRRLGVKTQNNGDGTWSWRLMP